MKTFFTMRQIDSQKAFQRNICLSLFMFILLLGGSGYAQNIYEYSDNNTGIAFAINSNLTGTSLTRGAGLSSPSLTCTGSTDGFGSQNWSTSPASSIITVDANGQYVSFTITPNAGYRLNITGFTANLRAPSGPTSARYSYLVGASPFVQNGASLVPGTSGTCSNVGVARPWASFTPIVTTSPVTFRIYGFNASSAAAEMYLRSVIVTGSVECNPAVVSAISPTAPSICVGDVVTLTGSTSGAVPSLINHSWALSNANASLSSPTTNITNLITGVTGGTVNATYTASYGSLPTCSVLSPAQIITVNPLPTITASLNPKVCRGTTTTNLAYSAVSNSPTIYSLNFDATAEGQGFADALNVPKTFGASGNIAITVPSGAAAGNYNATLIVENTATGCESITYNVVVTVNALPTMAANSNSPVCAGATLNLTAPGSGLVTYVWTGVNSFTATGVSPSINPVTTAASGTYMVMGTDANGCTAMATTSVTVNPIPTGSLVITETSGTTNDDGTVCSGDNATITAPSGYANYKFLDGATTLQNGASNVYTASYTSSKSVTVEITTAAVCTATLSGANITVGTCNVHNVTTSKYFVTIQAAINASATVNGNTLEVSSGTYNEQVLVDKELIIKGVGATKPIVNFTGTPALASLKLTAFEVVVPNVTIDNLEFKIDVSKLGSAIVASVALPGSVNNLIIKNNEINPYRSSSTTVGFGSRNAVNINYGAFRINTSNPTGILAQNNTISYSNGIDNTVGTVDDAGFRAGFAMDEGTGDFTGNTIQTISQDIELRFTNTANNINITNNNINGGGVNYAAPNISGGTLTISGNTFNGAAASLVANSNLLRIRDNIGVNTITTIVENNTFLNHTWALSLENYKSITVNNNIFTPLANSTVYHHITVNTKENASSSNIVTQTAIDGTFTNNTFNGSGTVGGTALMFLNHDNDAASYGTFTVGTTSNENKFNTGIQNFIAFDSQTGSSNGATFPTYPSTGTWTTTMAPWNQDIDATYNKFDVSGSLKLPSAMTQSERTSLEGKLVHKFDNNVLGKICLPNLGTLSAANTAICTGGSTNLSIAIVSATGPFTVIYTDGSTPVTLTGYVSGTSIPITPTITTTYSIVSITDAIGCVSTTGFTGTPTVTVNALPIITASSNTPVCTATALNLAATGGGTYAWTGVNSFTATGANPSIASATTAASGTYMVTVTDANGCTAMATTSVTVNALPTATASSNTPICAGTTLNLSASGGTSYAWTGVNSFTATGASPSISSATTAASGTYMVTVMDANGCTAMATTSATVNALPTATASSNTPVCAGATLTLSGSGGTSYVWAGVNSFTSTDASPSISSVTTAASGTYMVTVTNANGCTAMATTSATVNVLPIVYTVSISGGGYICSGTSPIITLSGSETGVSYKLKSGSTTISTTAGTGSALTITPPSTTSATYTIEAMSGSTSCVVQMSGSVSTIVALKPTISLVSKTNVSCNGGSNGTFTVMASAGSGNYTYTLASPSTTNTTGIFSGLPMGTYSITVTDNVSGCISATPLSVGITEPTVLTASTTKADVLCKGAATGTATVMPLGGTSPYTYAWTGPSSFTSISNPATALPAGTYNVTVTDSKGCTATSSATITEPSSAVTVTTAKTDVLCKGGSTGTVTATPAGGTGAYTYAWTGAGGYTSASANPTGLLAGIYNVTVKDANSCMVTGTVTVGEPATGLTVGVTATNVLCFGGATGKVNATPAGGTSPYTYAWTGMGGYTSASANPTGLLAGAYDVTVMDVNSCTVTGTVTVGQPTAVLSVVATATSVLCFGGNTGKVNATPTGGTGAYSYAWTGPSGFTSTMANPMGLSTGTYDVTITDANSCTVTGSVIVGQPTSAVTVTVTATNVLCFGSSTGSVAATPAGGTGAYSYAWTGPSGFTSTMANPTGLAAGVYNVTVMDANSCSVTGSATITQPTSAVTVTTTATNVLCFGGSTGAVMATPAGGTSPYTYAWTGVGGYTSTMANPTALSAGAYNVTVMDANSCTVTGTVTVGQPTAVLSVVATATSVLCFGGSTGKANATPSGGTPAYAYVWTGPSSFTSTMANPMGLSTGTYDVTITDANSCTVTGSVMVEQPTSAVAVTVTATNVLCFGSSTGSVAATPAGGTGAYSYAWTGPSGFTSTMANPTGLAAGVYNVTVMDANSCSVTGSATVTQPTAATTITASSNSPICEGLALNLTSTPTSATGGLSYAWAGPASFTATTQNASIATTTQASGGTYTVTVMDGNSCIASATTSVIINALPTIYNVTGGGPICSGVVPAILLSGSQVGTDYKLLTSSFVFAPSVVAGTGSQLSLMPPATPSGVYTIEATNTATGCKATMSGSATTTVSTNPTVSITPGTTILTCTTPSTTLTTSGSAATYSWTSTNSFTSTMAAPTISLLGTYTVTATEVNGCTATASVVITENKVTPTVTVLPTTFILTCTNPTTTITASGGNTYSWTKAGGGFTSTSDMPTISMAGIYTVIGTTTANGCTAMATIEVTENKVTPTIVITNTGLALSCSTPTTTITAGGASTYAWSSPAGFTAATATADILVGGIYTVIGTGTNGCTAMATVEVTENKVTPTIVITNTGLALSCTTPTTTITAGGASTYAWSSPAGFTAATATADILVGGIYTVIGTGANGCTAMATVEVTENKATPTIVITNTGLALSCSTPTTTITAGGANTYVWSSPAGFTATTATADILVGGIYTVIGTSTANGCTAMATVEVTENKVTPTIVITNTGLALSCTTPTTTVTAGGASTYTWSSPAGFTATTATADILVGGIYTVIGTGTNGCTAMATIEVTENKTTPTITLTNTGLALSCTTPTTTITASGASTYAWSSLAGFTANTATADILVGGIYTVIGTTAANGCTAMATVEVTENKVTPTVTITNTGLALSCSTPTTTITAGGASTYAWSSPAGFTATTATADILVGGIYTVIGTGTNGCTAMATVEVTENKVTPTVTVTGSGVLCSGSTINLTVTGGGTYLWSGPGSFTSTSAAVTIANATVSNSGTYIVAVTNANGCTATAMATITVNPTVAVPTPQATANIPTGGSVTLTATGCSGTLSWFKTSDDSPATMPVSPTVSTSYYAKCSVTANSITCTSAKSVDVLVNTGDTVISIITGGAWNDPATWDVNRVPLLTDKVIIDVNHNVIVTDMNAKAKRLEYRTNSKVTFGNPATKLVIQGL